MDYLLPEHVLGDYSNILVSPSNERIPSNEPEASDGDALDENLELLSVQEGFGHYQQAGLLPQGTVLSPLRDEVDNLVGQLLVKKTAAQAPKGWFMVSLGKPMYIVLVWGDSPKDLDAHMYTTASCKHCGRVFKIDNSFRGHPSTDPWAEYTNGQPMGDVLRPERITLNQKKPHGYYHYYVSNADGWSGEGRPDDLFNSNASVFVIDGRPSGDAPELLASFKVTNAAGHYGNYWDVFTMTCMESTSPDDNHEDQQRCQIKSTNRIQRAEPSLRPQAAMIEIEVMKFSLFAFIVENIFSYLFSIFFGICVLLCCIGWCASKSPKARHSTTMLINTHLSSTNETLSHLNSIIGQRLLERYGRTGSAS